MKYIKLCQCILVTECDIRGSESSVAGNKTLLGCCALSRVNGYESVRSSITECLNLVVIFRHVRKIAKNDY